MRKSVLKLFPELKSLRALAEPPNTWEEAMRAVPPGGVAYDEVDPLCGACARIADKLPDAEILGEWIYWLEEMWRAVLTGRDDLGNVRPDVFEALICMGRIADQVPEDIVKRVVAEERAKFRARSAGEATLEQQIRGYPLPSGQLLCDDPPLGQLFCGYRSFDDLLAADSAERRTHCTVPFYGEDIIRKIRERYDFSQLSPTACAQFIIRGNGDPLFIQTTRVEDFIDEWREKLELEFEPCSDAKWIGLIHLDGACLVEI